MTAPKPTIEEQEALERIAQMLTAPVLSRLASLENEVRNLTKQIGGAQMARELVREQRAERQNLLHRGAKYLENHSK